MTVFTGSLTIALCVVMILLICVYLSNDRRRFRVERQFAAVRSRFDAWTSAAAEIPACAAAAEGYFATRNISKKYIRLAELHTLSRGAETEAMRALEAELGPFCAVYNGLAEGYNRRLMGRLWGTLMGWFGFRLLPKLDFGE